eukprot:6467905-Amphidinium_carterae.1
MHSEAYVYSLVVVSSAVPTLHKRCDVPSLFLSLALFLGFLACLAARLLRRLGQAHTNLGFSSFLFLFKLVIASSDAHHRNGAVSESSGSARRTTSY